jgi:hypothetical protein
MSNKSLSFGNEIADPNAVRKSGSNIANGSSGGPRNLTNPPRRQRSAL